MPDGIELILGTRHLATIRKAGPAHDRDCDHADGCRKQTVFSRAE